MGCKMGTREASQEVLGVVQVGNEDDLNGSSAEGREKV